MRKILSIGIIIATSFLIGCGTNNTIEAKDYVDFTRIRRDYNFDIYKDEDTGIHYIKYSDNYGVGLCPRYKIDGSLYTE